MKIYVSDKISHDRKWISQSIHQILEDPKTKILVSFIHTPNEYDLVKNIGTLLFAESKSYDMYYLVLVSPDKTKYKVLGYEDVNKKGYLAINRLFKATLKNIRNEKFNFESK